MNPTRLHEHKILVRKELRRGICALSARLRRAESREICQKLLKTQVYGRARKVLVYLSREDEVDTWAIVREALEAGKQVFAPRIKEHELDIYRIRDIERDLVIGAFGICEPRKRKASQGSVREMDLILVPGLGFTRAGKRIGRGGGYYDRLLGKAGAVKFGLAFRVQLKRRLPTGLLDQQVDRVIFPES